MLYLLVFVLLDVICVREKLLESRWKSEVELMYYFF